MAAAGSLKKLSDKMRPYWQPSYYCDVEPMHDNEQGLDAIRVSFNPKKPPIFTSVANATTDNQEGYTVRKHGSLLDYIKTETNRAVYRGTGFFTANIPPFPFCVVCFTLVGMRIYGVFTSLGKTIRPLAESAILFI
jgi:hypothetical protein